MVNLVKKKRLIDNNALTSSLMWAGALVTDPHKLKLVSIIN